VAKIEPTISTTSEGSARPGRRFAFVVNDDGIG